MEYAAWKAEGLQKQSATHCTAPRAAACRTTHLHLLSGTHEVPHGVSQRAMQPILETERLHLRRLTEGDGAFMVTLLNQADFVAFVGDRGLRTTADGEAYIRNGPFKAYATSGLGPYAVFVKAAAAAEGGGAPELEGPIGITGLYQRDYLPHPDIGFAFLTPYQGHGYAYEAAACVLAGASVMPSPPTHVTGIVNQENGRSVRLLAKLGLTYVRQQEVAPGDVVDVWERPLAVPVPPTTSGSSTAAMTPA